MTFVPVPGSTQPLSFLVHSNWETGASERHSRAENGEEARPSTSLTPVSRAIVHLACTSLSITKRKERGCVQSIPERNFRTGTRTGVNLYRYDSYTCAPFRTGTMSTNTEPRNRTGVKVIPVSYKDPLTSLVRHSRNYSLQSRRIGWVTDEIVFDAG